MKHATSPANAPTTASPAAAGPSCLLHPGLPLRLLPLQLHNDDRRVITRPFIVSAERAARLARDLSRLTDGQVATTLAAVEHAYLDRHDHLDAQWLEHFGRLREDFPPLRAVTDDWSPARRRLAGAYLTLEYSVESAALFNPSVCLHPQQNDPDGRTRVLMSLRATGEGHVSSIVFRTGTLSGDADAPGIDLDPLPPRLTRVRIAPDRRYHRKTFARKLTELNLDPGVIDHVTRPLPGRFDRAALDAAIDAADAALGPVADAALSTVRWVAESNYHVDIDPDDRLDGMSIFPLSADESNGMEDVRLTRFIDDDGDGRYYGTYTAYNGHRTLPMLLETEDFRHIEFHSLNGSAAKNKGMALFPRKIDGRYVMCGRIDGERMFILRSESVHFWEDAEPLLAPREPWELMLIGNCGAPVETDAGWVMITHGVGAMRTYALGAVLLDRDDPTRVLGRLRQPLLAPNDAGREGYVPNVVYSCGSLVHDGTLYLPFALADKTTAFAVVPMDALIERLLADGP